MPEFLEPDGRTRRELLKFTGLAGAWLAMPALVANDDVQAMGGAVRWSLDTDVLVIGGGLAGIFAALQAAESGARVTLLDKGSIGHSGMSPWAAEIAACTVTPDAMEQTLSRAARDAEYLNDRQWTELHLRHAPGVIEELQRWGFMKLPALQRAPLLNEKLHAANVRIVERTMVASFLTDDSGRVSGALAFEFAADKKKFRATVVRSKAVVSCMGAGSLRGPGWPIWGLTHDGDALAYAVGARITGKEFSDPQPAFDSSSLVDRTRSSSQAFALREDPYAFDDRSSVLSRPELLVGAMRGEIDLHDASYKQQFPGATLGLGCHKCEGVVSSTGTGAADGVPGLYVAGDALGSMMSGPVPPHHGVSLIASAVQGRLAGRNAAQESSSRGAPVIPGAAVEAAIAAMWSPRERPHGYRPGWVLHALQNTVMPFFVSYLKEDRRLRAALVQVGYLRTHCVPRLIANDLHELRLVHELDHMLLNQEMKLRASLLRCESRGTHIREDFPARDDENWLCWIDLFKGSDGTMQHAMRQVPRPVQTITS